ncbi:hypothetical protein RP20_CCG013716 [Aedes albopictus]|nr:hypothetical protein RP20_CCG013716 [Aedes albopictus]
MNFIHILLVSCLLAVVSGRCNHCERYSSKSSYRQRHVHHWHHHDPFVHFEVREPKGLTVSIVRRSPNTTLFGIELYVNRSPKQSNENHCDVCQNTTSITFGKFIINDEEVLIKKGDVLYYHVLIGSSTNVTRLHLQKMTVTASTINRCSCKAKSIPQVQPKTNPGSSDRRPAVGVRPTAADSQTSKDPFIVNDDQLNEVSSEEQSPFRCDLDPLTNQCRIETKNDKHPASHDLEREVEILEAIVEQMRKIICASRNITNMIRLESASLSTKNMDQQKSVIRSAFSVNSEMKDMISHIRRVLPDGRSSNAVHLDMYSYVDKQKVLYHARMNNLNHISDYDSRQLE